MLDEKIKEKEINVRALLDSLRAELNRKSKAYNSNKKDWSYLTTLTTTEEKISEILKYIEEIENLKI